ncbi:hypothetical protein CYLTODRAFT_347506 [Cylindrobasidium torrendii FP15055 ss-10]|uniref:RING-type domain-containing protein n=1 Tax=Cylindrobasidium torrendii FP15055 ss-10 TaxID=1314674 RepID=A0A0D7BJ91_9AGAR|nr:hypothetical protein CYLTODRAFT_347506 [Cylindrobasidium torrendii FP15055 ss-10]
MPSCSICIDELKRPVSLPCGHVFCNDCVYRAVTAVKPYANLHYCPTCRAPYTTVNMDNSVVPDHLRPHVLPHIRRLFLDERTSPSTSSDMPSEPQTQFAECSRLSAENKTLRFNCDMWRKRAECHAAATLGLLNLARVARDEALQMKKERDELQAQFQVMKRKRDADE